jgi:hypothetical protein
MAARQMIVLKKSYSYLLMLFFFVSCYDISFLPNISIKNKTKKIVVPDRIHFEDTLAIINPFVKIYTSEDDAPLHELTSIVSEKIIPRSSRRFYHAERLLQEHFKFLYKKYFKVFPNKINVKMTIQDSLSVHKQMNQIKNKLSNEPLTKLAIPDTLYDILLRYHYKQFLVTDVSEFYGWWYTYRAKNIFSWYRFFVFDIGTKSLLYYNYSYDCGAADSPTIEIYNNFNDYLNNRVWIEATIKKINRQLKRKRRRV